MQISPAPGGPAASTARPRGLGRAGSRHRPTSRWAGWGFALPALVLVAIFGLMPILVAAGVSFTDLDIGGLAHPETVRVVGAANYVQLAGDPEFWSAFALTAGYVVVGVPLITVLALAVATGLNRSDGRFYRLLRTLYFLPAVTALVAISVIWKYMFNGQFGLFNWLLDLVGLPAVNWLSDPGSAQIAVGLVAVWRAIGLNSIILLAALQGVPPSSSRRPRWTVPVRCDATSTWFCPKSGSRSASW